MQWRALTTGQGDYETIACLGCSVLLCAIVGRHLGGRFLRGIVRAIHGPKLRVIVAGGGRHLGCVEVTDPFG